MRSSRSNFAIHTARNILHAIPIKRGQQRIAQLIYSKWNSKLSGVSHIQSDGARFEIDLSDRIQAIFYLSGLYEPETLKRCAEILNATDSPTYFDVGANVGLMGLRLKGRTPKAVCHFFEPDPRVFQKLKANTQLNSFSDVFLNEKAISDKVGSVNFFRSHDPKESGWGRLSTEQNQVAEMVTVPTTTLDDYVQTHRVKKIDLLKIDVEGAELQVLTGAKSALQNGVIQNIILEINEPALNAFHTDGKSIVRYLSDCGFAEIKRFELNSLFKRA